MKIKIIEVKEIIRRVEIKVYCCSKMKELYGTFFVLNIKDGDLILTIGSTPNYCFSEKVNYCPFCGKKIEVIEG